MKNANVFDESLNRAAAIRREITEKLRKVYNVLQKAYGIATGKDGKKLKFVTDMLYYRNGGYPNENSLPKHVEVLDQFIDLVKYMQLLGYKYEFVDKYLAEHGITVTLSETGKIENLPIAGDDLHKAHEVLRKEGFNIAEFPAANHKAFLINMLSKTMELQRQICQKSDQIKHNIAGVVESQCEIKKSDFTGAIRFKILSDKNKVNANIIAREKKNINSALETFNAKVAIVKPETKTPEQ